MNLIIYRFPDSAFIFACNIAMHIDAKFNDIAKKHILLRRRWGARRPADVGFAPTEAERRPNTHAWVRGDNIFTQTVGCRRPADVGFCTDRSEAETELTRVGSNRKIVFYADGGIRTHAPVTR